MTNLIVVVAYSLSLVQLYVTPWTVACTSPAESSVHGISQVRILEWVTISFSGDLPNPGIKAALPAFAGRFFTTEPQT